MPETEYWVKIKDQGFTFWWKTNEEIIIEFPDGSAHVTPLRYLNQLQFEAYVEGFFKGLELDEVTWRIESK